MNCRRKARIGSMLLLTLLLCGCGGSIAGRWNHVKSVPNRETIAIDGIQFNRDGTYSGKLTFDGRTAEQTGTYEFSGFRLTLRPDGGGQRVFNATRRMRSLELVDGERQVTLERSP